MLVFPWYQYTEKSRMEMEASRSELMLQTCKEEASKALEQAMRQVEITKINYQLAIQARIAAEQE